MIDQIDATLRRFFIARVAGITTAAQVKVQPPDDVWRSYVKALTVGGNPVSGGVRLVGLARPERDDEEEQEQP